MKAPNIARNLRFLLLGFILGALVVLLLANRFEMQAIRTDHGFIFYKIDRLTGRTEWTASDKTIEYNEIPLPWRNFPE